MTEAYADKVKVKNIEKKEGKITKSIKLIKMTTIQFTNGSKLMTFG